MTADYETLTLDYGSTAAIQLDQANGPVTVVEAIYSSPDNVKTRATNRQMPIGPRQLDIPVPGDVGRIEYVLRIRTVGATTAADTVEAIYARISALIERGGVLRRVLSAAHGGGTLDFDVLDAQFDPPDDWRWRHRNDFEANLMLEVAPYARGTEVQVGTNTETSLPTLTILSTNVPGEMALGRLLIEEVNTGAPARMSVLWGQRCRYYASGSTNQLLLHARNLSRAADTTLDNTVVPARSGNCVKSGRLNSGWKPISYFEIASGPTKLAHLGDYLLVARIFIDGPEGEVQVAADYGQGDLTQLVRTDPVVYPNGEGYSATAAIIQPLGVIRLDPRRGPQTWGGQLVAKYSGSVDRYLYVDWIALVPVGEGSGQINVEPQATQGVQSVVALDNFNQTAGNLAGKTPELAPAGNWSGQGDADDFSLDTTNKVAQRTAVSDNAAMDLARWERIGTGTLAGIQIAANVFPHMQTAEALYTNDRMGVFARLGANSQTGLVAWIEADADYPSWAIAIKMGLWDAGVYTQLASVGFIPGLGLYSGLAGYAWPGARISLYAFANGLCAVTLTTIDGTIAWGGAFGSSSKLATGGTLASGGYGILDRRTVATAGTRRIDNLVVTSLPNDAALLGGELLEISHLGARRSSASKSLWTPRADYEGDNLYLPGANGESRTVETIVIASRGKFGTPTDSAVDDLKGTLYATPLHRRVPPTP